MFCLCFPVGMLQLISTEHPWTSYVRRNSESSRESGSQPSTLMKMIPGSYKSPKGEPGEAHLNQLPLFSHGSPLSLSQLGMVNSGRDSNDTRHVSLLCFYPQCLTFQSPLSNGRKMAASIKSLNLNFEKSKTIPNYHGPPSFSLLSSCPCLPSIKSSCHPQLTFT